MITIVDKHNCCGCSACVQSCPKKCISFDEDEQGFRYPLVNKDLCIDCGLCEKVCPCLNQNEKREPLMVFAAKNPNEEIRMKSSSGGIFSMIAESIIKEGGVVFGARFDANWEVVHGYTENIADLDAFRGSKYVQSRIGECYKKVKFFLNSGRKVLFSGTPCQISGLKLYLKKDYANLYTIDFICHGVPSPGVFRWYLQEELNNYFYDKNKHIYSIPNYEIVVPEGIRIKDVRFRDKREGWKKYSLVINLEDVSKKGDENIITLASNVLNNAYLKGFSSDLYLRPSCHNCPSRNLKSGSDITLGDFWGQEYMFSDFDNDKGVSAIIIKTEKGNVLLSILENPIREKKSIEQVLMYNPSLYFSKPTPFQSKKFWKMAFKYSFARCVDKSRKLSFIEIIQLKIKSFL